MTEPTDHALARRLVVDPRAGVAAADAAADTTFTRYRQEQRLHTLRRQAANLALFARYLAAVVQAIPDEHAPAFGARLREDATAWANISWALLEGFVQWQLQQGYATRLDWRAAGHGAPLCRARAPGRRAGCADHRAHSHGAVD